MDDEEELYYEMDPESEFYMGDTYYDETAEDEYDVDEGYEMEQEKLLDLDGPFCAPPPAFNNYVNSLKMPETDQMAIIAMYLSVWQVAELKDRFSNEKTSQQLIHDMSSKAAFKRQIQASKMKQKDKKNLLWFFDSTWSIANDVKKDYVKNKKSAKLEEKEDLNKELPNSSSINTNQNPSRTSEEVSIKRAIIGFLLILLNVLIWGGLLIGC